MPPVARPEDVEWDQLRYFLAAIRAGSLSAAARALDVEHSTIRRRLLALEQALAAPLFNRSPDGLTPTPLAVELTPLLEQMERAALAITEQVRSRKTRVRLATPSGFARLLGPHLGDFHAAHPDVILEILGSSRPVDLKRGEADLAIRQGPVVEDDDLVCRPIGDVGWSLYAADAYLQRHPAPADPRQLAGHDLLGFETGLSKVPGARFIEQHGAGANVVLRSRELIDLLDACQAGLGLAVLPCLAAIGYPGLRRVTPEVFTTSRLNLVFRKEVLVSGPVKSALEFVTGVLREYAGRMSGRE
jgi:DNA-binding transcriptional LysR family regulator